MTSRYLSTLLTLPLALAACRPDLCRDEAPSFQLDIRSGAVDPATVHELRVLLHLGDQSWVRTFPVSSELADGTTSIAVVLDPVPTGKSRIEIDLHALDESGSVVAQGKTQDTITPDGCNTLAVTLDLGVPDGGIAGDAGPTGDAAPAADTGTSPDADAGVPRDATAPDTATDAGLRRDAAPDAAVDAAADAASPDGGQPIAFPFAPTNFDPTPLRPTTALAIDCGRVVVFDSTTLTFTGACGAVPTAVTVMQPNGPEAALIPVSRLTIASGNGLDIIGNRPVILAVFGEATVEGTLRAIARHDVAGAGSAPAGGCTLATGGSSGGRGGGGGGGFGGPGARGGRGGDGRSGGDGGDAVRGIESLSPLRGGCPGGTSMTTGSGAGGGGGGAVQISASATLVVRGLLQATGGGGRGGASRAGGGGGGSGGAIFLEANSLDVRMTAVIDTRGGGGGGGGENGNGAGTDGNDGASTSTMGGAAGGNSGGAGGDGADGISPATEGRRGGSPAGGGGGGGAGTGRARLRGVARCQSTGVVLPASGC